MAELALCLVIALLFAAIWAFAAYRAAKGSPFWQEFASWPEMFTAWFRRK